MASFTVNIDKDATLREAVQYSNYKVKCSMGIMGLGQFLYGQIVKGLLFLAVQVAYVLYLIFWGVDGLVGLVTLGTEESNMWLGIEGDNSVIMLILGVIAVIFTIVYLLLYFVNIKDAYNSQRRVMCGYKPRTFVQDIKQMFDKKFYITVLALPVLGVCVFNIMPIIFMILIAFTNYGGSVVPPALVDWVGLDNFTKLLSLGQFQSTFWSILGWNLLWAVLSTFINYFGGLALALLINKKCVKGKTFWRLFPILAYAIPGFITLLAFKYMFSYGGPINYYIQLAGGNAVGFLDLDAKWTARIIGLGVNAWISIPSSMLLATGILSNMKEDLYEAAKIDGANSWQSFRKITLPFVIFSTTPVLIGQFIGNFNNFGIFYFLRGGLYLEEYFLASDTDLLINWLYNLSIDNNYYAIGAAISLVIFIITSVISLVVYVTSPAYKKEDTYR